MKKDIAFIILITIALLFTMVACNDPTSPVATSGEQLSNPENIDQPTSTNHSPPTNVIQFNSMGDVKEFITPTGTLDSNSTASTGKENLYHYFSQNAASSVSNTANALLFPTADADIGVRFVTTTKLLDIVYVIDSIQYRFFYMLDADYESETADAPIAKVASVGPYTVNFSRRNHPNFDDQFYGQFEMKGICVAITVTGNDIENISFDMFDFVPLSAIN
jgi:hypothetical protein